MIANQSARQERVYGPLDYALTGIYACLAAFATGVSVGSPAAAWMFVGIIAAGTIFSFTVQWLIGDQPVAKYDGLLYLFVGVAVVIFREDLARMVPDQPFQEQLVLTGTFTWLLALGSFFTWRDGTLLFQAVPSIALFGMVGIFDTFKAVPFLFLALLVCLATLFARAHRRQMIEQAEASGYKAMLAREEAASAEAGVAAPGGARLEAILQGPWKWMAGPEWALASALVIVLVSLLGAPVMRLALKPIAGAIHIPAPPLTNTQAAALLGRPDAGRVTIGMGPSNLGTRIVLTADTDQKRYLRVRSYGIYDNFGWENANPNFAVIGALSTSVGDSTPIWQRSVNEIKNPVRVPFKVTVLDPAIGGIPVPGDISSKDDISAIGSQDVRPSRNADGTISPQLLGNTDVIPPFSGVATVASNSAKPRDAVKADELPITMSSYIDMTQSAIPQDIVDLAKQVTKGKTTDFDKAIAIQREIEKRCLYNLKAPRTPGGVDPVDNFLFKSHEGYCDLFASSMTLMARSVGIPSRYVTGFYPIKGTRTPDGNAYTISESEAHAWSELFFKDVGWVAFDATEGAGEVPGEGLGDSTIGKPWYQQTWFANFLTGLILVLVVTGCLYAFMAYRKFVRSKVPSRNEVGREYARFVAVIQRLSKRRRLPSQTPAEFLEANKKVLGPCQDEAARLTDKFVGALYSPGEISEGILKELRADTDMLRSHLRSNKRASDELAVPKK